MDQKTQERSNKSAIYRLDYHSPRINFLEKICTFNIVEENLLLFFYLYEKSRFIRFL